MHNIIASVVFAILLGAGLSATVPNPVVIGPIPATAPPGDPSHDYPFFSTTVNLASHGYVEQEFFFEGVANRYNTPELATGSVIDSGHPYRTRMVVRRPASARKFSGTVVMEWQNVTAGYDFDAGWELSYDNIIRRGYAWIGVSAQRVGVHQPVTGLKEWSPNRYGTLDVTQGGAILDDALSYDIFSQAAQAVRSPTGVDPWAAYTLSGWSRPAGRSPRLASSPTTTRSTRWPVSSMRTSSSSAGGCSAPISMSRHSRF